MLQRQTKKVAATRVMNKAPDSNAKMSAANRKMRKKTAGAVSRKQCSTESSVR